jgi:hypothetical protein
VGAVSTNQNAQQSAGATSSLTTSEEFASRGTGQSGSGIGGINQNINRVTTVTSTGAVVTISNGAGFTPSLVSPTITNGVQISAPVTNFQPQPRPAINPAINPIDNSYVPVTPNQNVVIPNIPTPPPPAPATNTSATSATNAQSCANFSNTYWTGYRCSCRVGFRLELPSGQCVRINLNIPNNTNNNPNPIIPNLPPSSCLENEVFTLNQCICVQGFIRGPQGLCIPNIICPPNSYPQGGICVCNNGFVRQGDFCVSAENCGPNAYHNGVICVCR